ncbi:MAG: DsrE family protein [Dehalobacterium sp.]
MAEYKVVFHVDENEKWHLVLTNVENTIAAGEDIEIMVLANAKAVQEYAVNGDARERMIKLSSLGVSFVACQNALKANNIEKNDLPQFVTIVPAGIVELIKRQSSGFCYIKP